MEPGSLDAAEDTRKNTTKWYTPTATTLFPLKKSDHLASKRKPSTAMPKTGQNMRPDDKRVDAEVVDTRTATGQEQAGPHLIDDETGSIRLRSWASIERLVQQIEDPEMRRLTALAYLS